MKNIKIVFTTLLMFLSILVFGQISQGGTPPSFKYGGRVVAESFSIDVDWSTIKAEDDYTRRNKFPTRVGFNVEINKGLNDVGVWSQLPDGRMMWRYEIELSGAQAVSLIFDKFHLPAGGELYLYDVGRNVTIGAFTEKNNNSYGVLSTQMLPGSRVVVEYCEQPNDLAEIDNYRSVTELNIGEALYVYNPGSMFKHLTIEGSKPYTGESEWCEVNVNCEPEGDNWKIQKRGVVALVMPADDGVYVCSGSMVNDAINSGTQYLLTAFHCGEGSTAADKLRWQFYFNYEYADCDGEGSPITNQMVSGCELVTESDVNKRGSDHLLVRLLETPSADWNLFYNGWDISSIPSTGGVGIHHPSGDVKKISTYKTTVTTGTFNSGMSNGFWSVRWAKTDNGFGVTEGGSSGSPLFNNDGLIIGTLTGGGSYCDDTQGVDLYGRMDKHWTSNGSTADVQLKPWLDPLDSGITKVDGIDPKTFVAKAPVANFRSETTTVAAYSNLQFTNLTSNLSTEWEWTFEGGTPSSSTENNPTVYYETPGNYSITLKSTNSAGSNTITKEDYVTITPYAGDYVIAGTGVKESVYPLGSTAKYERSAAIYTKKDIGSAGAIVSLGWFTNTTKKTKIIKIYLKHSAQQTFSTDGSKWEDLLADAQLVFNDTIVTTNRDWTNIDFSSVFQYDGESNVMVLVEQNNSTSGSSKCRYSAKMGSHQFWSADNVTDMGIGTRDNNRPNIRIGIYNKNLTPSIIINKKMVEFDGNIQKGDVKVTPETLTYTELYRLNGSAEWVAEVSAIGSYNVQVVVTGNDEYNNLTITSNKALVISNQLGVNSNLSNQSIKIYPNPTKEYLMLEGDGIVEVNIYDLTGKRCANFHNVGKLDVSRLHNGVYTVVITTVTGEQQEKIIISK